MLQHVSTISTLPEDWADWQDKQIAKDEVRKATSHCSEIKIHPSGTLLFVGNRYKDYDARVHGLLEHPADIL